MPKQIEPYPMGKMYDCYNSRNNSVETTARNSRSSSEQKS